MSYIVSVLDPNPGPVEVPEGSIPATVLASGPTSAMSVSVRVYIPGSPPITVGTYPLHPSSPNSNVFEGNIGAPHTTFRLELTASFPARGQGNVTVVTDIGDYDGIPPGRGPGGGARAGTAALTHAPGPRPT